MRNCGRLHKAVVQIGRDVSVLLVISRANVIEMIELASAEGKSQIGGEGRKGMRTCLKDITVDVIGSSPTTSTRGSFYSRIRHPKPS